MKTVVQRVTRAEVRVGGDLVGRIDARPAAVRRRREGRRRRRRRRHRAQGRGAAHLPRPDARMDLTVADVGGACLVVSQFTLCAALGKGNRPSFEPAAEPARAEPLYLRVADGLRAAGLTVETGRFGADMAVDLVNDGPVTFWIETRDGALVK